MRRRLFRAEYQPFAAAAFDDLLHDVEGAREGRGDFEHVDASFENRLRRRHALLDVRSPDDPYHAEVGDPPQHFKLSDIHSLHPPDKSMASRSRAFSDTMTKVSFLHVRRFSRKGEKLREDDCRKRLSVLTKRRSHRAVLQGLVCGNRVYVSGQGPRNPETGKNRR